MNKVTFHYTLDSYVKSDGTQNILLRITQNRKHRYIDIGYSIPAEDWNKEKKEVRRSNKLYFEIQLVMDAKLIEAKQLYLRNKSQDLPISPTEIKHKLQKELVGDSFLDYAENFKSRVDNPNTWQNYETALNKLKSYLGKGRDGKQNDFLFPEFDYKFIDSFRKYLKKDGTHSNSINSYFTRLKTIYTDATGSKFYRPVDNAFDGYKPLRKEKTKRVRLKETQIEFIEKYQVKPGSKMRDAINMFLFSYYMQGMRVRDVLELRWRHIKGEYMHYKASKTKKSRSRKIHSRALAILEYYRKNSGASNDYIFPYLRGVEEKKLTDLEYMKNIKKINSKVRNHLLKLRRDLVIDTISIHVARHSYATIALRKTKDVRAVSDSLDHASIAITEGYFGAAEPEENDDLVEKVFGK